VHVVHLSADEGFRSRLAGRDFLNLKGVADMKVIYEFGLTKVELPFLPPKTPRGTGTAFTPVGD
jgi:hypothetical protein